MKLGQKQRLPQPEWEKRMATHRARAEEWTEPYRSRRAAGKIHPIHDFLFIYYRFPPSLLERWHPGPDVLLEADTQPEVFSQGFYTLSDKGLFLDSSKIKPKACQRLVFINELCRNVASRPSQFGCFGMHEWAMVYRGGPKGRPRHEGTLPLRIPQAEVDALIERSPLCCSHFDAYRFFTDSAKTFNKIRPNPDSRIENEQSGCLHTNMDLYKWTAKSMPWIGSELLWDAFEFAVHCREIDMRASPYDCTPLGYEPIRIETESGRTEYEKAQRALSETAKPLRARLIKALSRLS
jgi:hypothetical protein